MDMEPNQRLTLWLHL